ncbi:hypothetical protein DYBT9275_02398 [Dyadobacter sp. CECT 9275]|uniref:Uncharacterized protein n=1 Tax=Dyadobacter helix TaxID=2822344 RepID=A0A916JCI7_9BACT|nr:hypothetical protein [Dyadobacter sp. CECT 9275]CAG5000132.1 hypothetical protein DYBT9275_02398 [Dyadobacter sp. CECT 9275]
MENILYKVVAPEMVWIYYYDELKNKHFRELLGAEARRFIDDIPNFSKEPGQMFKNADDE